MLKINSSIASDNSLENEVPPYNRLLITYTLYIHNPPNFYHTCELFDNLYLNNSENIISLCNSLNNTNQNNSN